ncbi:MAG: macro domain-containing protein [Candidatus Hadarchaeales archaeon]
MKVEIKAMVGDLTKVEAEAICNPANSLLVMGGGAAGAIKRAAGEEVEREAVKHAPLPVGKAVATSAGKLRAKWVVHAPTMERPAMATTPEKVYRATIAALRCAEGLKASSLAIPGMGTGVGGVSPDDAAGAMVKALKEVLPKLKNLKKIILCDIDEKMVEAWKKELGDLNGIC